MTRAVLAVAYGGAEVLEVSEVEVPEPGPGQVLVDVRAAAYNPADWKLYGGLWGTDPAALPRRVGMECAGVVAAVGEGSRFAVGDEVVVYPANGAFAEQVLAKETALQPKPAGLAWEQAAGLLLAGVTAWHALEAVGLGAERPESGADGGTPRLLVHGGAGAVGSLVVQLALGRGVQVVASCGASNEEYLRSLGAEPVRYGEGLTERVRSLGAVDAAIDTVGTEEAIESSVELVADRERVATIANFGLGAERGVKLLGGGPGADPGTELRRAARGPLLELAAAGRLSVRIAQRFPLEQVREAHELIRSGHAGGKVILEPQS